MKNSKLLFTLAATLAAATLWGATETVDGYTWTYNIEGDGATIFNYYWIPAISPTPTGAVTIPSTLGGVPVTGIGHSAFYDSPGLLSVKIPDSITFIGHCAFYNCSGLTSVTIPASVTSIAEGAFSGCRSLASFSVDSDNRRYSSPDGLLIDGGTNLIAGINGNVTIPASVTRIGNYAFQGCSGNWP